MNYRFIRFKYEFNSCVKDFCKEYLPKILLLLSIYIIGVIVGFVIVSDFSSNLTEDNLLDKAFYNFLCQEYTWLNFFFSYILLYSIYICFVVFLNKNIITNIINIIILFVMGYIFAYNILVCIAIFTTIAQILLIIICPIFNLITIFLYCCISSISWSKYKILKKYGKSCLQSTCCKKEYIITIVLLYLSLFLYSLAINIFRLVMCI